VYSKIVSQQIESVASVVRSASSVNKLDMDQVVPPSFDSDICVPFENEIDKVIRKRKIFQVNVK
jgi:hypothetical protein